MNHCTFSNATGEMQSVYPYTVTGMLVDESVFVKAFIGNTLTATAFTISNSFFTNPVAETTVINLNNAGVGATLNRNYIRSSAGNMWPIKCTGTPDTGTHTLTNNIHDDVWNGVWTWVDLGDFYMPSATPPAVVMTGNLGLSTGMLTGNLHPAFSTVILKNNTVVGREASDKMSQYLYLPEGAANTGTITIVNNIAYGNGFAGEYGISGAASGDNQIIAYSDYNSFYNIVLPYTAARLTITAGNTTLAVPGSYDKLADPKFVDNTRNLSTWNARFGSGTASFDDALTYLMGINGYRGTPYFDQNGTVSVYGVSHLVDWVRYGFSPTNGLLRHAGDPSDGSPTMGAVEWQNPRRK